MKKIISLLLAACLLTSMTAGALAANWTPALDKTTIKAGEEVKVTVSLDEPMTDIATVGYDLYFDDELFTYKEDSFTVSEELEAVQGLLPEVSNKFTSEKGSYHSLNFLKTKGTFTMAAGEICSLVFVSKADLQSDATSSFELEMVAVLDEACNDISGHGTGKAASITVTANKTEPDTGVTIPDGAPFTAITTDKGAAIAIEDKGAISVTVNENSNYSDIPYYHVTIPADAAKVSVSYPAEQDPYVDETYSSAYGYYVDVSSWEGGGLTLTEYSGDVNNGYTVTFPLETTAYGADFAPFNLSLILNEDGSGYAAAMERNDYSPIAFFTFSYGAAETPSCSHSETETSYDPVTGKEEHTVTVTCKSCTETVGEVTTESCTDEDGDYACDKCSRTILPAGYYVSLSEDKTISAGESVNLEIAVGNRSEKNYNAYYFTVRYDSAILSYTGSASGVANDGENGVLTIAGYGQDKACATETIALPFKAVGIGEATVSITAANIDKSANANSQNAPKATVLEGSATVTVGGYTVNLGNDFTGEGTVGEGDDYTFTAKDLHYDYTISATMGGDEVAVKDNGDGSYTIEKVTGNLVITSSKEGKTFTVTLGDDMTGDTSAQYTKGYTATLNKVAGYTYGIEVEIGGKAYTGFSYDEATGGITIPGEAITGVIVFNTNKTAVQPAEYGITFAGGSAGDATGEKAVAAGADYIFTLSKAEGHTYTVSATMGGETVNVKDNGDGSYTIKNVTGNLVITVEKTADNPLTVAVSQYLAVDESVLWLVTAAGAPEGTVLGYDGSVMYWSDKYEAYAWLVFSAEGKDQVLATARDKVAAVSADKVSVAYDMDVNNTGLVDINDAQTVYGMYNAQYENFSSVPMGGFLEADVNGSKSVNVDDAAAIVSISILKS